MLLILRGSTRGKKEELEEQLGGHHPKMSCLTEKSNVGWRVSAGEAKQAVVQKCAEERAAKPGYVP